MPFSKAFLNKVGAKIEKADLAKTSIGIEKQRSNVVASIDAHVKAYIDRDRERNADGKLRRVKRVTKTSKAPGHKDKLAIDIRYGATEQVKLADEPNDYLMIDRSKEREFLSQLREGIIDGDFDSEIEAAAAKVTEVMNDRVRSKKSATLPKA